MPADCFHGLVFVSYLALLFGPLYFFAQWQGSEERVGEDEDYGGEVELARMEKYKPSCKDDKL